MNPSVLDSLLNLDYDDISVQIRNFISTYVEEAGANGAVLGLSGGVDSTVTAQLAAKALSSKKMMGLILPDHTTTPREDVEDAENTAKQLGIKTQSIDINLIHNTFMKNLRQGRIPEGNLRARIRMCLLYYYANLDNRIVIGTGDRSEILIGYYTKYGDGGVDILPIGGLYKTQVRALAKHLNISSRIVEKQSSPRLWAGQTAEDEIGQKYEVIDPALHLLFDLNLSPERTEKQLGNPEIINQVLEMNRRSQHKRETPQICKIQQPT
ncbi:MAG: NAD+ synthase [Thaumarchaeota archaeon]|nr:NAD+ synthase [Nitrososphaerota archaeon]MCL5317934.1 NAD+ synthase [Nitrososphaerota archaeon]